MFYVLFNRLYGWHLVLMTVTLRYLDTCDVICYLVLWLFLLFWPACTVKPFLPSFLCWCHMRKDTRPSPYYKWRRGMGMRLYSDLIKYCQVMYSSHKVHTLLSVCGCQYKRFIFLLCGYRSHTHYKLQNPGTPFRFAAFDKIVFLFVCFFLRSCGTKFEIESLGLRQKAYPKNCT